MGSFKGLGKQINPFEFKIFAILKIQGAYAFIQ